MTNSRKKFASEVKSQSLTRSGNTSFCDLGRNILSSCLPSICLLSDLTRLDLQMIKDDTMLRFTLRVRPSRIAVPGFPTHAALQCQVHCQLITHAHTVEKELRPTSLAYQSRVQQKRDYCQQWLLGALATTDTNWNSKATPSWTWDAPMIVITSAN